MYEKRMLRIIRPIVHILQEMSFRSDPALKAIPDNELLKTLWGAGEQGAGSRGEGRKSHSR